MEWLCVRECFRFALRHRRYLLIFAVLYWHSLRGWKRARAARYGYCFLQVFDDIMDGDRSSDTPPQVLASQVRDAWTTGTFRDDTPLLRLGAALYEELGSLSLLPGDEPRHDVLVLLDAMRLDNERVAEHRLLTRAELADQLQRTFYHSLNLLLIASHLRTRASQVPDLVRSMAWCSVVRDLEDDLRRGLVNIPADVVAHIQSNDGELTPRDPDVRHWLNEEERDIRPHLDASALTLHAIRSTDPSAATLLGIFQRSVEKYATPSARMTT